MFPHDSLIRGTWLTHMQDMKHSYMRQDSVIWLTCLSRCGTWLIHRMESRATGRWHFNTLQYTVTHCSMLQYAVAHWHTVTYCNMLPHTAKWLVLTSFVQRSREQPGIQNRMKCRCIQIRLLDCVYEMQLAWQLRNWNFRLPTVYLCFSYWRIPHYGSSSTWWQIASLFLRGLNALHLTPTVWQSDLDASTLHAISNPWLLPPTLHTCFSCHQITMVSDNLLSSATSPLCCAFICNTSSHCRFWALKHLCSILSFKFQRAIMIPFHNPVSKPVGVSLTFPLLLLLFW